MASLLSRTGKKSDAALPYDRVMNLAVEQVPPEREVYLRYQFELAQEAEPWVFAGIQTAHISVHHQPRQRGFTPIEVTYCWVEHRESGDLERQHTELVTEPAYEYTIHVAGFRDPTMKWLRMNLSEAARADEQVTYGYSDGHDVGTQPQRPRVRYTWGKNLALGRPYTLSCAAK